MGGEDPARSSRGGNTGKPGHRENSHGKTGIDEANRLSADSVHKVFSSTFETIPTRRGVDPFRIAPAYAIGAGIHSIRAGRH